MQYALTIRVAGASSGTSYRVAGGSGPQKMRFDPRNLERRGAAGEYGSYDVALSLSKVKRRLSCDIGDLVKAQTCKLRML